MTIFGDRAVFEDPHTVLLLNEGRRITADKILIATGNRPTREMGTTHIVPGGDLCITSDEAFHLDKLPGRILIAGGGYIALEFAHIFHGAGQQGVAGLSRRQAAARLRRGFARRDHGLDAAAKSRPCCSAASSRASRSAATACTPRPTRARSSNATR